MKPNREGVSFHSPEDESRSSFRNGMFCTYQEFRVLNKSTNPVILSVIYHLRNPLDSTYNFITICRSTIAYPVMAEVEVFSYFMTG
jgi:hypothetical protein